MEDNLDIINGLVNFRKLLIKNRPEIKKYEKIRKLHEDVLYSLENYLIKNIDKKSNETTKCLTNEKFFYPIDLDSRSESNRSILFEIFIFKTHPDLKSITEEYVEKNKFRNPDKIKMLNAMNNSVVGLFKVVDVDFDSCIVTYEDVFTHKKYKLMDISFSTIYSKSYDGIYMYNRLITYDNITFGTGSPISFLNSDKKVKDFIKKHNYKNHSNLYRCLYLYYLCSEVNNEL